MICSVNFTGSSLIPHLTVSAKSCFSWPMYNVHVILIFGCMMMDLMRKKVKITLKEKYGERLSQILHIKNSYIIHAF